MAKEVYIGWIEWIGCHFDAPALIKSTTIGWLKIKDIHILAIIGLQDMLNF